MSPLQEIDATGTTPKSPGQVREVKKTIAKILTIINSKKKLGDQKSPSSKPKSVEKEPKAEVKKEPAEKAPKEEAKASEKNKTEEKING